MNTENQEQAAKPMPAGPTAGPRRFAWRVGGVVLLGIVSIPIWRATTGHGKANPAPVHALPVAVVRVTREDLAQELVCDAELRPYQEIDLHSKVAGFLEKLNVDIGDRVNGGDVVATIEVPELQDDLNRALAALKRSGEEVRRAEAAYEEAHLAYARLAAVDKEQHNLIAQQDLDAAQAKDRTTASALAAAKAEVDVTAAELDKLRTMLKYSRITAPFPGVITKRYADPGALIQAGTSSSAQGSAMVRLSQNDRLRLDIPISVSYVSRVNVGDPVEVRVGSCEKTFTGAIARSTRKVETATRTMEVEVDVPNADLKLIPGMYASVVLRLERRDKTLVVPVEGVSRQKACSVFVVNRENKIEERAVSLGLETPHKLEVLAGLSENELVMIGSRTQVRVGQQVEPKLIAEAKISE
jgi:RND family efflux transporter MFP subunit